MIVRPAAFAAVVDARCDALAAIDAVRRVWRRDATLWGGDAARHESVANRLGWLEIATAMRAAVPELDAFGDEVRAAGFTAAVLLGMGGSSLAPEVLRRSIPPRGDHPPLRVLDTTDPATILSVTRALDLEHTLFFVSSKSGGTIEVATLFAYFHALVRDQLGDRSGECFVAITDPGTSLQQLASEHGFRRIFTNAPDIGGRYSALSYFGLAPAAVAGIDIGRLLDGAIAAMDDAKSPGGGAFRLGVALGEAARAGRNKCTFVIAPSIDAFGLWAEQLIAESTGKEGTGILPVADEPLGTPRHYGDDRIFAQLRAERDSTGDHDSVIGALIAEGYPGVAIDLYDAYDLGREFFRWEFATAVAGLVLGINPFDEPNVQESKDNTGRVLREFEASGMLDRDGVDHASEPIAVSSSGDLRDDVRGALTDLFAEIGPHDYLAITAYVPQSDASDEAFNEIRALARDELRIATTLGYGPRFLHSTGQLHKGGPPQGVFLQITVADAVDVKIPGTSYTFGQLKRAQAIGDFESLIAHGRPVLRVHLGRDFEAGLEELVDDVRAALGAGVAARS